MVLLAPRQWPSPYAGNTGKGWYTEIGITRRITSAWRTGTGAPAVLRAADPVGTVARAPPHTACTMAHHYSPYSTCKCKRPTMHGPRRPQSRTSECIRVDVMALASSTVVRWPRGGLVLQRGVDWARADANEGCSSQALYSCSAFLTAPLFALPAGLAPCPRYAGRVAGFWALEPAAGRRRALACSLLCGWQGNDVG